MRSLANNTKLVPRWRIGYFLLIGLLPFVSGAAALSHELLWTRRLVDILGATDWVVGRVLGCFFLGISLGAYLSTLRIWRSISAIKQLMLAEFAIAVLALPAAFLPLWTDWIWAALGVEALVAWPGIMIKALIGLGAVLPASIAMGFTMPLFIRAVSDSGNEIGTTGIWVYAINTIGGVFGLWATSTCLLQWWGAQASMLAISSLNLLIAVALGGLVYGSRLNLLPIAKVNDDRSKSRKRKKHLALETDQLRAVSESEKDVHPQEKPTFARRLVFISFVSGFIVLSLEVLLLRLINLVVPSSYHSTSAMLANVILILAIGSLIISFVNINGRATSDAKQTLLISLFVFLTGVFVCLCPAILYERTNDLISVRYLEAIGQRSIESIGDYWLLVFWLVAATGGLALFSAGLVFPTTIAISSRKDPRAFNVGILLAANGIGGIFGSEFSNSVLVAWFGIYQAFFSLSAIALAIATIWVLRIGRIWAGLAMGAAYIFLLIAFFYNSGLPYVSPRSKTKYEIKETYFSREGVLLVVENESGSKSILVNNQYVLGSSGAAANQRRQLTLPWVLHQNVKSVCVLGLATGISASGLEFLVDPPEVTAVELSETVAQISRENFEDETNGFYDRAKNQVVVEDARVYMAAANNEFDMIVGDLYRPFGTGEGRLYSLEHFQNVRNALTDKGVFCQWIPVYQLNFQNWKSIAATFQQVFPQTLIVKGNLSQSVPVIGLIGRKDGRGWQAKELESSFNSVPSRMLVQDPVLDSFPELVVGVLAEDAYPDARINTLDNLEIEIAAGNFWILKDLRPDRAFSFETEFIKGDNLEEFSRRLELVVEPFNLSSHNSSN